MSTTNQPEQPQSRLDREISEILEEARKRPISFHDHVARKRSAMETRRRSSVHRVQRLRSGFLRNASRWALRVPLLTALVLAAIAVWVVPDYRVLSSLLAIAAIVLIFAPYAMRRPGKDPEYQTRWRGRITSGSNPAVGRQRNPRSWLNSARDRFGR